MYREKIDVVIAYVNPNDEKWQREYLEYKNEGAELYKENRFRDTSYLKYVMRSIDKYMKFVNRVHLVVAYDSQVPEWVNRETVNVVLHKDFIPEEYLPVFNCNTIESFMHFIPNLEEKFVYFNDDMIINKSCGPEDFFKNDKCNILSKSTKKDVGQNTWYNCQYNGCKLINNLLGIEEEERIWHIFPHTVTPLRKSLCERVFEQLKDEICSRITRFRDYNNLNQHFYAYYEECVEEVNNKSISVNYINVDKYDKNFLGQSYAQTLCINDIVLKEDEKVLNKHNDVVSDLEKKYRDKSKYENGYVGEKKRDDNDIDVIMMFVNPADEKWLERYNYYKSLETDKDVKSLSDERIRDFNFLKAALRSIDEHMPFVSRLHLVVQSDSQVPDWVNRETVNVVLHEDFIPKEFLPTFNGNTIEMFFHRIPNIAKRYIVFNDDMLVMKDIKVEDIYDGMIPIDMFYTYKTENINYHYNVEEKVYEDRFPNLRRHPHINNNLLAFDYNGIEYNPELYYKPSHGYTALNKDLVEDVYNKFEDRIKDSCTLFRDDDNMYSYAFRLCSFLKYKKIGLVTTKFYTFNSTNGNLSKNIKNNVYDCICLNDDGLNSNDYELYKKTLSDTIYGIFNKRSKYEKEVRCAICVMCKNESERDIIKWIEHYKNLGVDNVIFYDNNDKSNLSQKNFVSSYIDKGFVIYKNYRGYQDRQKILAYKNCYEVYSENYDWIGFFDIDENVELNGYVSIKDYLLKDEFNKCDIIQINRISSVCDKNKVKIFNNELVKSFIKTKNKNITFNNNFITVYDYCTHSPNPKTVVSVCDCDGNMVNNDPFYNKSSNTCIINHNFCLSFDDLLSKLEKGSPKDNKFSQYSLNNVEDKLKIFFKYFNLTEEHIERIQRTFPNYYITRDVLEEKEYIGKSDIDYVFPYVDFEDIEWQEKYNFYKLKEYPEVDYSKSLLMGEVRYKNWGLLKYKIRLLEKNMPWIRNIYMLVDSESQVPHWIKYHKNVKVVYHKDFIPNEFLPLFNSSSIEMFLGNIEGLSEKFIYGNDDFYAIKPMSPYMFFRGEKSLKCLKERKDIGINEVSDNGIKFRQNGIKLANKETNIKLNYLYEPNHCFVPMHKSTCKHFLENYKTEIYDSISRFREDKNYQQYLYTYYDIFNKKSISYEYPFVAAYISVDTNRTQNLINSFFGNNYCISIDYYNDVDEFNHNVIKKLLELV